MSKYEYKATNLIAEAFEKRGVKFEVKNAHGSEVVLAGFPVDGGPPVTVWFISRDDDNDVAVRVFRLIAQIPESRRARVKDACNIENNKVRHLKFYLDADGDVNVEYDFPENTPDEGIGEMALEMFIRTMKILDTEYGLFMKAIYTDEELDCESLMRKLERLRRMQEARMAVAGDATDTDDSELDMETFDSPDNATV